MFAPLLLTFCEHHVVMFVFCQHFLKFFQKKFYFCEHIYYNVNEVELKMLSKEQLGVYLKSIRDERKISLRDADKKLVFPIPILT